jgi:hypothetical protein
MNLNKEAEEYANNAWGIYKDDVFKHDDIITDKTLGEITTSDFIAGVNSKYVQSEKIKAQIEVLKELSEAENKLNASLIIILEDLQKQLNEHENEKDNG